MKKTFFLIASLIMIIFTGCSEIQPEFSFSANDPIESYDTQSVYLPQNESQDEKTEENNGS